ncbi:MAG: asparagine synthase (glutamine-hydrolyzing) [Thermoanaerobaculia bacterium]
MVAVSARSIHNPIPTHEAHESRPFMSGLLCVYSASGIAQDLPRYLSALRRLVHRGPDGEGALLRQNLFLGVRVSSVGPGAMGQQPLVGAEGKISVALDGHIHDREELAHNLRGKGHRVDASSDPALVLAAYAEYGEGCFEKLKGVWAIVLWDEHTHRLVVSRDRLGVRPLYYFSDGPQFLLASEIKSILSLNAGARAMNRGRVREFVRSGRIDDWTDTLFARIRPVPPGTTLQIHADQVISRRYWTLRPSTRQSLTPDSILDKLVTTVERHIPTDVPVGLSLSGGIDSSSIACILAQSSLRGSRSVRAFSITPPKTTDESFLIDATVRHTGIPHSYVALDGLDYPRSLAQLIDFHDEPIQFSGVFYQFVVRQRMAEAGCRAVVVGYGADEIFGGYEYLAAPFLAALLADGRLADSVRFVLGASDFLQVPAFRIAERALRYTLAHARAALLRPIKRAIGDEPFRRLRGAPRADLDVLGPLADGRETARSTDPMEFELHGISRGRAFFRSLLRCFRTNIPLIVRLEDRNAMAHGLDLCAPFMDHELVEAALALPFHRFMEGGRNKAVLRNAVQGLLAAEVSKYPRKLATPGNDAYVAFEVLRPQFLELLNSESFYSNGLWSRRCEKSYGTDSARGTRAGLWFRVYMVQKWCERVVQSVAS